jgi:hypothetical protein
VMDWTTPAPAKGVHVAPLAAPGMLGLTLDLDF